MKEKTIRRRMEEGYAVSSMNKANALDENKKAAHLRPLCWLYDVHMYGPGDALVGFD